MQRITILSPCRIYRYTLWRDWTDLLTPATGYAMFIGLNPSTADETNDDPTIRRCVAFAKAWGYDSLCMTNLFAYRATDPADMMRAAEPVGPENDRLLREMAASAGVVVAAWGTLGVYRNRASDVRRMLPHLSCLRLTKDGHPGHPLYLPQTLRPVSWPSS